MSSNKTLVFSQQNLTGSNSRNGSTYEFENFRLDAAHLMLYQDGNAVGLKPKVVETLVALVERAGEVIGKDELMTRLWGDTFVEESNLTQNIYLLRKTLGKSADGKPYIENFSRRGYRFNGELKMPAETQLLVATQTRTQTIIDETYEFGTGRSRLSWIILVLGLAFFFGTMGYVFRDYVPKSFSSEFKNSAGAPFQNFKLKRHSDKGNVTGAVISPDGKFIAYSDKDNALWLKNIVTDGVVQILPSSENLYRGVVAISPDNNYIYYFNQNKEAKSEILKMSLFGGTSQQKITGDIWSDAALSPDGQRLSFVRIKGETGEHDLVVANTDGTGERVVATNQKGTWFGIWSQPTAWSRDGRQIACVGGESTDGKELWLIRIFDVESGKELSSIKTDPGWNSIESVAWLPHSDHLLVISRNPSSEEQLYEHAIATGEWHRLTNDLNNYDRLSVAADGKTVVTVQYENLGNLWLMPANGDVLQAKQITFGRNLMTDATGISWTPDGKIVYATNPGGKWGIWMIDADGANQKELTQNCAGNDSCSEPVVTPNGRYIVFQATRSGVRNIWRMEADGSNPTQLTSDGGSVPSITNDGLSVVYIRPTSPATSLWQIPIEGGEARQFSRIPSAASAAFSPDSKRMAFGYYDPLAKNPWQTCVALIKADTPEKCYGISRSYPRWAADGKAFYYLDHGYAGIWKQPLAGERSLFLEFAGERTDNFTFSPDGKNLVVARSKPTQDIVVITDEN